MTDYNIDEYPRPNPHIEFQSKISKINVDGRYDVLLRQDAIINQITEPHTQLRERLTQRIDILAKHSFSRFSRYYTSQEIKFLDNYLSTTMAKLKNLLAQDFADVYAIVGYLDELEMMLNVSSPFANCDIIDIYLKHNPIINMMLMIYDPVLLNMENKTVLFDVSASELTRPYNIKQGNYIASGIYLFTRCFASVAALSFLLGAEKKLSSHAADYELINNILHTNRKNGSYLLVLAVSPTGTISADGKITPWTSPVDHVFSIIKTDTTDENGKTSDIYYVVQSFFYAKCPNSKAYNFKGITYMIREIASIFYRYPGASEDLLEGDFTKNDNKIWKKYFGAEQAVGDTPHKRDVSDFTLFDYHHAFIQPLNCYENIKKLIKSTHRDILKLREIILNAFLLAFMHQHEDKPKISIADLVNAVNTGTFINKKSNKNMIKSGPVFIGVFDKQRTTSEDVILYWYQKFYPSNDKLSKYKIEHFSEIMTLLKVLCEYDILMDDISIRMKYDDPAWDVGLTEFVQCDQNRCVDINKRINPSFFE